MNIFKLSKDILYVIISQLSLDDIGNLLLTCKFFRDILDEETIYQYIYSYYLYPSPYYVNTGIGVCTPENWRWKDHYREQYYLQYITSIQVNYGLQLFHRYLTVDLDDQWTIIKDIEDYGRLGETEKPMIVCFYDIEGLEKSQDDESLINLIDNMIITDDQNISNEDLFDDDDDNEYISLIELNNDDKKIEEDVIIDLDNLKTSLNNKQKDLKKEKSLGWVNHVSKEFVRSVSNIIDVKSLIETSSSPFRDFWIEGSKEFIQKLIIKMLTDEPPYSKSEKKYNHIDKEYANRFSKYVYNLFDMDKSSYKSYYCLTAEKNIFSSRHYEAICIISEERCLFIYWVWNIDNNVSFLKACKDIKSFLLK